MILKVRGSAVHAVMTFHPSYTEDNLSLQFDGTTAEKVVHYTGIRFRKIARNDWSFKEYAIKGVKQFLDTHSLDKDQIDVLVCVTQSNGTSIPSLSFFLHEKLELSTSVYCIDVNSGCSGYVQGIQLVQSILATMSKKECNGLLICGDLSSNLIDPKDQSVRPIFSDAISVTQIKSSSEYTNGISTFSIDADGKGRQAIYSDETTGSKLQLNGIDVFNHSIKMVPSNLTQLQNALDTSDFTSKEIFFHQANKIINNSLVRKMGFNSSLVPSTLYDFGNTASASIPLTICNHFSGRDIQLKHLLLCGFGIGFSVASGFVFFDTSIIHPPQCLDL
jgi:3-oxoacyl-[acyl-carrier-protein] synthase-3